MDQWQGSGRKTQPALESSEKATSYHVLQHWKRLTATTTENLQLRQSRKSASHNHDGKRTLLGFQEAIAVFARILTVGHFCRGLLVLRLMKDIFRWALRVVARSG